MASLADLEARVAALETDEDFANTQPAGGGGPANDDLQRAPRRGENARLAKENADMKKLLAKQTYRITHLIRTIEGVSA